MKVMLINAVAERGSTGRICSELAEELQSSGNDVKLLYASGMTSSGYAERVSNGFLGKVNALLARITGLNAHFCRCSTSKIIRRIKQYQPDVIHLHNGHAHYLNLPRFLKFVQKNNIPLVITLHDCWFFTGKCTHYTSSGCENWKTRCKNCPRLKKDIPSFFFDRTEKMFREKQAGFAALEKLGVIGVSQWITNEAKNSPVLQNATFTTIYNWIDTAQFQPTPDSAFKESLGISGEKKIVACVSDAWMPGADRYRDLLRLAGALPEEYVILLGGKTAEGERLPENIRPLGYLGIAELVRLYSNADVYVHLSHEDTFGKVIVEALACGTPVVAYDTTVYREIVDREFLGECVAIGDPEELVRAICKVSASKQDPQQLAAYVKDRFSKKALIDETIDFYRTVCKK